MDEIKVPESDGKQTVQPTKLDLDVKVFPSQRDGNLLASANITLGGCFAVKGLRVMNGRNGPFVAMPDWKDSKGERHGICFPVTKDMREAINSAVMGEYQRTVERIATRGEQAPSIRKNPRSRSSPPPRRRMRTGGSGEGQPLAG